MPKPFSFTSTGFLTTDLTSGIENLPPRANKPQFARLSVGENVRFTSKGGVQNRLGFQEKADLATSAKVDYIITQKTYGCMVCKSGTGVFQSKDGSTWYDIGLTQTAGEKSFLFPYGKDVFITNKTDSFTRVAFSTANGAIGTSDTEITVRTGDIGQFASGGGTVYIEGDAISYTGVSGNDLTGVTAISAAHADGAIITQTATPTGAPKGSCMAELQAHALVGGASGAGSTLSISLPANPDEPTLFYEFRAAQGATSKTMPSNITALWGGKGGVLIGMERGIDVASDFDDSFGSALLTRQISRVHSVPNPFCMTDMGEKIAILTTEGRVLLVQDTDAGFIIIEDEEDPTKNFDYPISRFVSDNKDGTDNSQNWVFYDPAKRTLHVTILLTTGITQTFVYQRDTRSWSVDTSKSFGAMTTFNDRVYAAGESDDKIYLDDELRTDATVPIISRMVTGVLNLDQKRVTGDWLNLVVGGLISHPGQFAFSIAVDGDEVVSNQVITSDDLIDNNLMTTTSGVFIGGGDIGAQTVGGAGDLTEAFRFTLPYEFMAEGESAQIEIQIEDESTAFELRDLKVEGESEGELTIPTL